MSILPTTDAHDCDPAVERQWAYDNLIGHLYTYDELATLPDEDIAYLVNTYWPVNDGNAVADQAVDSIRGLG
ncbi:hypothetical protein [Gordonia sihwensis]|uniref:hypothetical protein n=1 Tax=Gordonia sihwensis TaxID=173559 RepID=UPI003D994488